MKKIQIFIISVVVLVLLTDSCYNRYKNLYNGSLNYTTEYKRLCQGQVTTFDGYYLEYIDQKENASVNKEIFIEVSNIIMQNKKDGEQLAWKWVRETYNIPFEEFTIFYKNLSNFIAERYASMRDFEAKKQAVVKDHNYMINSFPNNVMNYFVGRDELEYSPGFVTDTTKNLFKSQ